MILMIYMTHITSDWEQILRFQPLPLYLVETLIILSREKDFKPPINHHLHNVSLEAENSEKLLLFSSIICLF